MSMTTPNAGLEGLRDSILHCSATDSERSAMLEEFDAVIAQLHQPSADGEDARRYRGLRDNDWFDPASQPPELAEAFSRYTGAMLDAAIDAAIGPGHE